MERISGGGGLVLGSLTGVSAFTLAEVLITLAVIGVVAAMTMPTLVANYKKQQTITHLQKAFATLGNGILLAAAHDNPLPSFGDDCAVVTPEEYLDTYIKPYFKVIKTCTEADGTNCGYPASFRWISPDGTYKGMGMYEFGLSNKTAGATLADGTFVLFYFKNSDNTGCHNYAYIDLNGPKGANTLGKDVFFLLLNNDSASPVVFRDAGGNEIMARACTKGGWGLHCLAKIIGDGWEIKDNYPW